MSQQLLELCALLVRHEHGDLPHVLYSTLLEHDRLQLRPLAHKTSLSLRYVKSGLAVLINHGLVTFYPRSPSDATYYQADKLQAYNLVRAGLHVDLIQQRHGVAAARVAETSQYLGLATASQILYDTLSSSSAPPPNTVNGMDVVNGINGHAGPRPDAHSDYTSAMQKLEEDGMMREAREHNFMSEIDLDDAVSKAVLLEHYSGLHPKTLGPKKVKEFRDKVNNRISQIKRGCDSLGEREEAQAQAGQDDEATRQHGSQKRRKTNNGSKATSGNPDVENDSHTPPPNAKGLPLEINAPFLSIDRPRLILARRSEVLSAFTARRLGETSSLLFNTVLRVLENEIRSTEVPDDDDEEAYKHIVVNASQIIDALDPSTTSALLKESSARDEFTRREEIKVEDDDDTPESKTKRLALPSKTKKHLPNGIHKRKHEEDVTDRELLRQAILTQFQILAHDPKLFVYYEKHLKTISVDFHQLTQTLVQFELERTINARFGPTAARMTRILYDKGKLEEKQIGQFGLVQQKELRTVLSSMQEAGYMDVQEVPRDNSRQPSRSIYLWSYDQDHCRNVVLERVYKAMCRLLQRYESEKGNVSSVLDKAQRTDVQGHEDEFLSPAEQGALRAWNSKEEKLYVQLTRLDELVLLFRDCQEPLGMASMS